MPKSAEDILKDLRSGTFAPLYFLQGDEPYYIDRISDFIEDKGLEESEKGFNLTVVYGRDTDMPQVLGAARRFPMMAQRQVVIVKEAQGMNDKFSAKASEILENYAKKPQPTTVLVFCHKNKKLNGNTKLSKTLDKHAVLVDSKKMYDNKLPAWSKSMIKSKGFSIGDKAAFLLCEHIGNDLDRIENEVDKLKLNLPAGSEISENDIYKHIGLSKDYNVFELQDALASKKKDKVWKIVRYFASNPKNHPVIPIVALLYGYFSKILMMHGAKTRNKNELVKILKVSPFFVDGYLTAAANYPLRSTVRVMALLHLADLQSKGIDSLRSDDQILKELIYGILNS